MAKPLSEVQELVELTIFHALRAVVVDNGYCPNIMAYPNDATGSDLYWRDFEAITTSKGFSVEVFNNSNPEKKGIKKLPRMVIISESMMPGEIGGDGSRFYTPTVANQFQVLSRPPQVMDFNFKVHVLADTAKQARICAGMLANSIPTRGYIPIIQPFSNFTACNLFIEQTAMMPLTMPGDGVLEYAYSYVVKDLWLEEYSKLLGTVVALQEIRLKLMHENHIIQDLYIQ